MTSAVTSATGPLRHPARTGTTRQFGVTVSIGFAVSFVVSG